MNGFARTPPLPEGVKKERGETEKEGKWACRTNRNKKMKRKHFPRDFSSVERGEERRRE
jgi:hypothetical protein